MEDNCFTIFWSVFNVNLFHWRITASQYFLKSFFKINWCHWRITALQYCVGLCHTCRWVRRRFTHVPVLLNRSPICQPFRRPRPPGLITEPGFDFSESCSKFPSALCSTHGSGCASWRHLCCRNRAERSSWPLVGWGVGGWDTQGCGSSTILQCSGYTHPPIFSPPTHPPPKERVVCPECPQRWVEKNLLHGLMLALRGKENYQIENPRVYT